MRQHTSLKFVLPALYTVTTLHSPITIRGTTFSTTANVPSVSLPGIQAQVARLPLIDRSIRHTAVTQSAWRKSAYHHASPHPRPPGAAAARTVFIASLIPSADRTGGRGPATGSRCHRQQDAEFQAARYATRELADVVQACRMHNINILHRNSQHAGTARCECACRNCACRRRAVYSGAGHALAQHCMPLHRK